MFGSLEAINPGVSSRGPKHRDGKLSANMRRISLLSDVMNISTEKAFSFVLNLFLGLIPGGGLSGSGV